MAAEKSIRMKRRNPIGRHSIALNVIDNQFGR
jgi:hypothetical protein